MNQWLIFIDCYRLFFCFFCNRLIWSNFKTIQVNIFGLMSDFAKSLRLKRISLQSIPRFIICPRSRIFFAKTPPFFVFFLTKAFQACFHIKCLLKRASFVEKGIMKGMQQYETTLLEYIWARMWLILIETLAA